MNYSKLTVSDIDCLWKLQKLYKEEIGEEAPEEDCKERLCAAIAKGQIFFFGAWDEDRLIGCCSVTSGSLLSAICRAACLRISIFERLIGTRESPGSWCSLRISKAVSRP